MLHINVTSCKNYSGQQTLLLYSSTNEPRANRNLLSGLTDQFILYTVHGASYLYISFRFAPPPPPAPPAFPIDPELPVEGRVALPEFGILDPPVNAFDDPMGPDGGPEVRDPGAPGCANARF